MDDLTANSGGQYTCDPGTNTLYYDEDLDGNVDDDGEFNECWYDDCSEDDEDEDDYWDGDEDDDEKKHPGALSSHAARPLEPVMEGFECQSCDCEATTHDLTADDCTPGESPASAGTNTYYYDEDRRDGNVDDGSRSPSASYDDCSDDDDDDDGDDDGDDDDECDIETSNDLNSSPSGTTNHGAGRGGAFRISTTK